MTPLYAQDMDLSGFDILVVDDVPLNLILVQKMLARFNPGIRTAANGMQALKAIGEHKPDLVLLDLMMPVIDGFEVLRRIRQNPETADVRVVILSALNSNEDIVQGFQLGANDFITKPIIMEKLVNAVMTQLQLAAK